ncbi:hypothetical protein KIK06_17950 [Nocardiopsis sp. EMB25]|uniref:hypothetical protein n=1 Tax=Nocardiopsis sp. EMB25 TaxID=2835867 RepID=UPI0022834578|nr:hypothetical protein [Nocardiopsis sp. EMB25]MCY9785774.1 hypothetical protein [Nocardiopsis sp. EMB25]
MTMPRKGTRRITVDGVAYRWRVRARPTRAELARAHGRFGFAVEAVDTPGHPLVVTLDHPRPSGDGCCPFGPPSEGRDPEPVTPARVAEAVRAALSEGWAPGTPGGPFRYALRTELAASVQLRGHAALVRGR